MHAPLLQIYDLARKRMVKVGREGKFGPEAENGAAYTALASLREGRPFTTTNIVCGAFYPAAIILTGCDERGDTLSHEQLDMFKRRFRDSSSNWIILPKGWDPKKGGLTWENGIKYYPDWAPSWYSISADLTKCFPGAEVIPMGRSCNYIMLQFDNAEFKDNTFTYEPNSA